MQEVKNRIAWQISPGLVAYEDALQAMEARVQAIHRQEASELVWLLEHPPLYTCGTSASSDELTGLLDLPVYPAGRGGRFTYHGPGQRIVYVMIDLKRRGSDVRRFVWLLEEWVIRVLADLGIQGERRDGRVGVWVRTGNSEAKIAALGVRLRRWISFHGISINLDPDLSHYEGIVPCGISDYGVTSLRALGADVAMAELDRLLHSHFLALPELALDQADERPLEELKS